MFVENQNDFNYVALKTEAKTTENGNEKASHL